LNKKTNQENGNYSLDLKTAFSEIIPPQLILDPAAPDG
jgi:hypothetical protein